ncbi:DeoR/GlpR family DNA-binding transcription regulator [Cryobacterium mannosilyticum]|uniref:DeoR/GlpR transcriptional regulator n=1 Tax=Cryobacterium mannosilyticum TaxID=1259190 RepID=A0A4R8WDK5_9MICO|nr:DeoR/GlpR family DNA-binding transcription regulator [Cryobacterium mannosilyticum]TFC07457.1 DeoR/GlpR transcriptional regulator [Cryobacterium mannosilyticum]
MSPESMRYTGAPARRAAIVDRVRATGFASIADLSERLNVSEMTVRRDVRRLQDDGDAVAVHGGVRLRLAETDDDPDAPGYNGRESARNAAKRTVGRAAAECVLPDDVIAVDAGTTTMELARALSSDFHGTVITHSLPVINRLLDQPAATVIALGGDLHRASRALVGSATVEMAHRYRVRTFYLAAAAVDERGVYASADVERLVKLELMDIADRVVLLIDHGKFAARGPVFLCDWGRLSAVVTDRQPPAGIAARLLADGIDLVLPAESEHEDTAAEN